MKDPAYAAKLEKAIAEKYGKKAIVNPLSEWTDEDEKAYQQQQSNIPDKEKPIPVEQNGFSLEDGLIIKEERVCSICSAYSFSNKDSVYLLKFKMCYKCYCKNEWALKNKETFK